MVPGVVEGTVNVLNNAAAPRPAMTKTASWTRPRMPMPRTLPMSRSRGADGGEHDLDDPALLLLDDAGQHREPEAEDADEDEDGPDVGDEEAPPRRSPVRGSTASTTGGFCAAASAGLVHVRRIEDRLHPQGDDRGREQLRRRLVDVLLEPDLAGGGRGRPARR